MGEESLMDERRQWFLEMESAPGEDAMKTVEMTTEDLEYYINSAAKAATGFKRTNSNSERVSVGRRYQTALPSAEKSSVKGRVYLWGKLHCCPILRLRRPPQNSTATTLISQLPSTSRPDPLPAKSLWLAEGRRIVSIFLAKKYF